MSDTHTEKSDVLPSAMQDTNPPPKDSPRPSRRRVLILANAEAGRLSRWNFAAGMARRINALLERETHPPEPGMIPDVMALLAETAAAAGLAADVEPIVPAAELAQRIQSAQKEGYDTIVAAGGDGTVRSVAQALVGSPLRLGILPVGTANNVARSLHIPTVIEEALGVIANGVEQRMDVGRIGDEYFLEAAGVGLFADAITAFGSKELRPYQVVRALRLIGPLLWNLNARSLQLTLDGARLREQAIMIVVSNTAYLGEGIPIAPDARSDDGLFDVLVVGALRRRELLRFMRSVIRRTHLELPKVYHDHARIVEIRRVLPHLRPLAVHADDHIAAHTPIRIEIVPNALRVLVPAKENGQD